MDDVIESMKVTYKGVRFDVQKMVDHDSTVGDSECYSPVQISAWKSDEWHYVGLVITVEGADDSTGASLWGIEDGRFPVDAGSEEDGYSAPVWTWLDAFNQVPEMSGEMAEAVANARKGATTLLAATEGY